MNRHDTQARVPAEATALPASAITGDVLYSIGESTLGTVLVAHSPVGVCAILMGDTESELTFDLAARFPHRAIVRSRTKAGDELEKVLRFIDQPSVGLDLTFDMRHGTDFQRKVWNMLIAVPCGATTTYTALAHRIGQPEAVRAVAGACAANAIALGVPCHRVLRSDGTLSGYRWGVERKRALIEREARS